MPVAPHGKGAPGIFMRGWLFTPSLSLRLNKQGIKSENTDQVIPPGDESVKFTFSVNFNLIACAMLALPLSSPAAAQDKVSILQSGTQPGHYLEWGGQPILPIGDSATQGWMEGGSNFDQTGYIDALADRGVNLAMIWSYVSTDASGQVGDGRIGYDAPEIWPWQGSTDGNSIDLSQFNQTYFDRLASFVSYAQSNDILVLITLHDGWPKTRWSSHPFNTTRGNGPLTNNGEYVELADYNNEMPTTFNAGWNDRQKNQYYQERFADKLIMELEPYSNVIYEMFNEGEWYDQSDRKDHEEHFLEFFRDRTDALLMTNTDHIAGDDPHANPNADIFSYHRHSWTGNFGTFASAFDHSPAKPHFMSESIPEFNGTNLTMKTIRQSAWEIALAGAGWVAQNDTSFGWDPNAAIASQASARDEAYTQIGHVARFLNSHNVPFWDMAPDGSLSTTGIVLANPGHEYVVYAPTGGYVRVNLAAGSEQPLGVEWYDPRTGVTVTDEDIPATGTPWFVAPDGNDWVLRIGESKFPGTAKVVGWEFNTDGNSEDWLASATAGAQDVLGGTWNLVPAGADPMLTGPEIDVAANVASVVEIGMRSTDSDENGQLFWMADGDAAFSEARSQSFRVLGDGQMHTYRFDLSGDPDWTDRITRLRLDPVSFGNGGSLSIDFIRLLTLAMPGDFNDDGVVDRYDLPVWQSNFGSPDPSGGDADFDGDVDGNDFLIWQSNFGQPAGFANASNNPATVPEPGSVWLLGLGIALLLGTGQCRNSL
jgi:collagenase-like protein with putative collagen-binding domain